jgi:hypothetical protein
MSASSRVETSNLLDGEVLGEEDELIDLTLMDDDNDAAGSASLCSSFPTVRSVSSVRCSVLPPSDLQLMVPPTSPTIALKFQPPVPRHSSKGRVRDTSCSNNRTSHNQRDQRSTGRENTKRNGRARNGSVTNTALSSQLAAGFGQMQQSITAIERGIGGLSVEIRGLVEFLRAQAQQGNAAR